MNHPASSPCPSPRVRADVVVRRGARFASLIAGAFAMSLLGGADGCTITVTPIEECIDLDDVCPNLECEVFATDDDGCALCECEAPPPPTDACYQDADCDVGEYCDFSNAGEPVDDGTSDNDSPNSDESALVAPAGECRDLVCPAIAPAPPQCNDDEEIVCSADSNDPCYTYCYCVPVTDPPPACLEDSDCRDGQRCELSENCPGCVNEDPACEAACYLSGVCVDEEPVITCANVLCAEGTQCIETADGPKCEPTAGQCDDDSEPLCDMMPPICEDGLILAARNHCYECVDPETCEVPPSPLTCANVDCAPGYQCVETDASGPTCVEVNQGCYSDNDCDDNATCNASEVCDAPPGCEDGADCLAVCYGQCIRADDA